MRCARALSANAINLQLAVIRVGIKLNVIYILKDQGCLCDPKLKVRLAGLGSDPFKDIVNIKDQLKVFGQEGHSTVVPEGAHGAAQAVEELIAFCVLRVVDGVAVVPVDRPPAIGRVDARQPVERVVVLEGTSGSIRKNGRSANRARLLFVEGKVRCRPATSAASGNSDLRKL